jgi:hypothetical protein
MIWSLVRWATLGPYYGRIVRRSIRQTRKRLEGSLPSTVETSHYGATYIDPKHLAIWFLLPTTADLDRARASGLEERVRDETKAALARNGYPALSLPGVAVGLESRENVDKGGGFYHYFK